MLTGRRRIGKTTLIREAYKDEPFVYFFVARKAEGDLCEAYIEEVNEKLGIRSGSVSSSSMAISSR